MNSLGLIVAMAVDLFIPAVLAVLLIVRNHDHRRSNRTEWQFWRLAVIYLAMIGMVVLISVVRDIPAYQGWTLVIAAVFALPLSAIPAIVNSNVIHLFYTPDEWAAVGYATVVPTFALGLLVWALLGTVALRALGQRHHPRYAGVAREESS